MDRERDEEKICSRGLAFQPLSNGGSCLSFPSAGQTPVRDSECIVDAATDDFCWLPARYGFPKLLFEHNNFTSDVFRRTRLSECQPIHFDLSVKMQAH